VTRERLPNRRAALIVGFTHITPAGQAFDFTAHVGFYPDGRPGEVFVDAEHLSSQTDVEAHDAAIVLSFALQHGASLGKISAALLRGEHGEPHGVMGSLADAIKREIGDRGPQFPSTPSGPLPADGGDKPLGGAPAMAEVETNGPSI
jgi:hypothetical protein